MATTEGRASVRKLTARERERTAFALKKAGATYQAIGDKLGVSKQAVSKMLKRVLAAHAKEMLPDIKSVRILELARLDTLLMGVWSQATKGDGAAVDRALKIIGHRREMLGVDAPKRAELGGLGGEPIQFVGTVVPPDRLKDLTNEELDALSSIVAKVGGRDTDPGADPSGESS